MVSAVFNPQACQAAPEFALPIAFHKVNLFFVEPVQLLIHHILKLLDALLPWAQFMVTNESFLEGWKTELPFGNAGWECLMFRGSA